MIAALPNPRISVLSRVDPAAFVFDGGEGRVTPYIQRPAHRPPLSEMPAGSE